MGSNYYFMGSKSAASCLHSGQTVDVHNAGLLNDVVQVILFSELYAIPFGTTY